MPTLTTKDGTELYVKDWGEGRPVVLIHGWPLNADSWEHQALGLAEAGYRVVSYDRRGFGRSAQPWTGYDYDTMADDLAMVIQDLYLRDALLVGFSMGGGEVARYMARHNGAGVKQAALIGSIAPYMLKTDDNPDGVPADVLDGIKQGIRQDRPGFFQEFLKDFYGEGTEGGGVSDAVRHWTWGMAMMASPKATLDCVDAFGRTDLREDMGAFTVPTLVVHGDADQTVPIDVAGRQAAKMIEGATLKEYEGAPHGLTATHGDRLTRDLVDFLKG
ncbi:Pimeloyl-ACP methyl ester carboxylesterase [Tranquillimonas rosea]|uniref:Pimeloyl-ACP methyl ester carboxylesterase n=1 Tax=Tranquillimonas rosea TaxID=641238 RepID=A0A1H9V2I6_9RHOB|nr:alpha/beta hydrolase [Tranquillimonas rosea]SES15915.1 Pimeloyl-ACP methyl ester carboxylesterase [Tranquillimonas rosea]